MQNVKRKQMHSSLGGRRGDPQECAGHLDIPGQERSAYFPFRKIKYTAFWFYLKEPSHETETKRKFLLPHYLWPLQIQESIF
jgi:hypothetical protein